MDAFPDQIFDGQVNRVRLNATMTQNVVTYTVEVNTDNSSGKLLPYLTANVQFETGRKEKVLMVPNAALRWTPTAAQRGPPAHGADAGKGEETPTAAGADAQAHDGEGRGRQRPAGQGVRVAPDAREGLGGRRRVRAPIPVTVGLTDGINTEVSGDGHRGRPRGHHRRPGAGDRPGGAATADANPFTPQLPARKRR